MRWLLSAGLVLLMQGMAWGQAMKIYDNIYEQKDAAIATPQSWQALVYNGTKWANIALSSQGSFTNGGTSGAPQVWTDGVTVFIESQPLTASNKYSFLPAANSFPPGTPITFIDDKTVVPTIGRIFRPKAASGNTINGGTADVGPVFVGGGYPPAAGTGLATGLKIARFVTDGANAWRRVDTGVSVSKIESSTDASKSGTFDMSFVPVDVPVPMTWPAAPFTGVIPGDVAAGLFLKGYDSQGRASSAAIIATNIIPNEFTVGAPEVAAGTIHTVTDADPGIIDTVKLAASITVPHTFVFPDAGHYEAGATIRFYSSVDSLGVAAHVSSTSGNTFNGRSDIDITEAYFNRVFVADPISGNWTVSTFGGTSSTGLQIKPFTAIPRVSATATLTCSTDYLQENNTLDLTTASTALTIVGATNGKQGILRVKQDATGGRLLTFTQATNTKTASNGSGVIYLSSGANAEDELLWSFDGSTYNVTTRGLGLTAQAPPLYTLTADTGGTVSTAFQSIGGNGGTNDDQFNFGAAGALLANGGVSAGVSYTIGKIDIRMKKIGSPTFNVKVSIVADNGSGAPSTTQIGTASDAVSASTLTTSDAVVTFSGFNATLVSGTNYFVVVTKSDTPAPVVSTTDYIQLAYQSTPAHQMYRKGSTGAFSWVQTGTNRWLRYITYK